MAVSIAMYGIRLKNGEGKFMSMDEKNIFNQNLLEVFYTILLSDVGKDKEIGHPEISASKIYNVKKIEKLPNGNVFGKISYGESIETDIDVLKKEEESKIEKIVLNKKNGIVAPNFHFYIGSLVIIENGKPQKYLLLLLQKTNKTGIKSSVVKVYEEIINKQLQPVGYKLDIKVFNYTNYENLLKTSSIKEIIVFKKDFADIKLINEIKKMYETEKIEIENIIKIKKVKAKLKDFAEGIFSFDFSEKNIEKICTKVKINDKIKTVNLNQENERVEAFQTSLDITEKYNRCNEEFEKVLEVFEEEFNDIKVGVGDVK